ncbi:hypothetical protein QE152_g4087 [Popillia japonica]|uniref:Uncharacterized protein n=1 Tax=Popillia japonica TaxID=7064 RepID=A0AAW1N201_POPJA
MTEGAGQLSWRNVDITGQIGKILQSKSKSIKQSLDLRTSSEEFEELVEGSSGDETTGQKWEILQSKSKSIKQSLELRTSSEEFEELVEGSSGDDIHYLGYLNTHISLGVPEHPHIWSIT